MQVSERWLRTLIDLPLSLSQLADQLTYGGIEVEGIEAIEKEPRDSVLMLKITPDRGDCLSLEGVARELATLNQLVFKPLTVPETSPKTSKKLTVKLMSQECPRYMGRVIQNIHLGKTPSWMAERLEISGIRSISPVVDVMNYVMLEVGQPMHAFDCDKLKGDIEVRYAKSSESLKTLDGVSLKLNNQALVIADNNGPQALAGIIGGEATAVSDTTRNLFLESAYFDPIAVRLTAQQYRLRTDSSFRFERGIDPGLQKRALERATQLLLEVVGGEAGPLIEVETKEYLPQPSSITLRFSRIEAVLGPKLSVGTIEKCLTQMGASVSVLGETCQVEVPSYRTDLLTEIDLVEEIARLYGYDQIEARLPILPLEGIRVSETHLSDYQLKTVLVDRGYHEIKTYSFTDPKLMDLLNAGSYLSLENPLSEEISAMRNNLWPGLLQALQFNVGRKQTRLRLFEMGTRFVQDKNGGIQEETVLSGAVMGSLLKENWANDKRLSDFFDVKEDLEAILQCTGKASQFSFKPSQDSFFHPGQGSTLYNGKEKVGVLGRLHPKIQNELDLPQPVILFELRVALLKTAVLPVFQAISKYPALRRDIAVIVDEEVWVSELTRSIETLAEPLLKEVIIFDIYSGKGVPQARKSVALGLILQHTSRTLVDEEVANLMAKVIKGLEARYQATLRE